jgi:hypothetical protein
MWILAQSQETRVGTPGVLLYSGTRLANRVAVHLQLEAKERTLGRALAG